MSGYQSSPSDRVGEYWKIGFPESTESNTFHHFTKEEVKIIISETVAAVFERERLYKEYDRLTAEFDRKEGK